MKDENLLRKKNKTEKRVDWSNHKADSDLAEIL